MFVLLNIVEVKQQRGEFMLNKITKQIVAAIACAMLIFGICFSGLDFVSEAFTVTSDESKDEDSDKPVNATISSVDFTLRANGALSFSASDIGTVINHETSILDMVMDSADELAEKSFYEDKIVSNVAPYLNIRESDDGNSEVVGKLYPASYGTIIEQGEEWTKITSGSVTGYVKNEYVSFADEAEAIAEELGTEAIIVDSEQTNIHSSEDTTSEIITEVLTDTRYSIAMPEEEEEAEESEEVTSSQVDKVKELYPEWVPIIYTEEQVGYVLADDVTVIMALEEAVSLEEEQAAQKSESETVQSVSAQTTNAATEDNESTTTETSVPASDNTSTAAPKTSDSKSTQDASSASVTATSSDEYLLAALVYCEAGNQSYEGQLAVANVVLNRVNSSSFGGSISEVVYQANQFSPASNGSLAKALNNGPSSSALQAARDALAGNNNIGNYLYFNGYVDTSTVGSYTIIGDHTFYNY